MKECTPCAISSLKGTVMYVGAEYCLTSNECLPVYKKFAELNPVVFNVKFCHVNKDKFKDFSPNTSEEEAFFDAIEKSVSIPSIIFFKDGKEINRFVCRNSSSMLVFLGTSLPYINNV